MTTTLKKTRGAYEQFLSELYPTYNDDKMAYLIEQSQKPTKLRKAIDRGKYGFILRKYDPIAFNVGYGEWSAAMTYTELLSQRKVFDASGIENPHEWEWATDGLSDIYYPKQKLL